MKKLLFALYTVLTVTACGTLTPAQKLSVNVITCRYSTYVKEDQKLNDQEKQQRLELVQNLNSALKMNCDTNFGR